MYRTLESFREWGLLEHVHQPHGPSFFHLTGAPDYVFECIGRLHYLGLIKTDDLLLRYRITKVFLDPEIQAYLRFLDEDVYPKVLGKELVRNLVEQALQYKPTICLDEKVQAFEPVGDRMIRLGTDRNTHWTRTAFITVGIGMFTPRKLPRADLARFEGKGLAYFVKSLEDYRDTDLLIVGGGDSAFDWCLNLEGITRSTTLIHRRDRFRAFEDSVRKVMESRVRVKTFTELGTIEGADRVEAVIVVNNRTKTEERLAVSRVLACLGFSSNLGALKSWGLAFEDDTIVVNTRGETGVPGVYAAGDVVAYPGKVKLIATGFGEAATAINNAAAYINPSLKVFPGHSSTLMDKPSAAETGE